MTADNKKRKYKLFSATDDRPNSEKPCAFFFSEAGCRNGEKCSFSHSADSQRPREEAAAAAPEVQSDTERAAEKAAVPASDKKKARKEKKADKHERSEPASPAAAPAAAPAANPNAAADVAAIQAQMAAQKAKIQMLELAAQKAKIEQLQRQLAAPAPALVPVPVPAPKARKQKVPVPVPAPAPTPRPAAAESSSDSSSSSDEDAPAPAPRSPVRGMSANFLVPGAAATAGGAPAAPALPKATKTPVKTPRTKTREEKAREQEEDTAFLFGAVNTALSHETPNQKPAGRPFEPRSKSKVQPVDIANLPTTVQDKGKQQQREQRERDRSVSFAGNCGSAAKVAGMSGSSANKFANIVDRMPGEFPFVEACEVAKNLATSGTDHATKGPTATGNTGNTVKPREGEVAERIDKTDFSTLQWGSLVAKTHATPRFKTDYSWGLDASWVRSKQYNESTHASIPPILAIDCEMCASADPVTGITDPCTLIRFSVVNGLDPSQVLIDELVQPSGNITEARTHIHQITEEQLKGVTYTLRHAQAALLAICHEETIIVGHSVHNDLKALHYYHTKCIDTAYLYTVEGELGAAPSMRDVSESIIGDKLNDWHDSLTDAKASLRAAAYLLIYDKEMPEVPRIHSATMGASLLVHRIPENCADVDIFKMISTYTNVNPNDITAVLKGGEPDPINENGHRDKVNALFASKAHADLAFDSIPGPNRPDKTGRAQKRVYYSRSANSGKNDKGGYICIRKNTASPAAAASASAASS